MKASVLYSESNIPVGFGTSVASVGKRIVMRPGSQGCGGDENEATHEKCSTLSGQHTLLTIYFTGKQVFVGANIVTIFAVYTVRLLLCSTIIKISQRHKSFIFPIQNQDVCVACGTHSAALP